MARRPGYSARVDPDELTALLDRHGDAVWTLAVHATGDEATAERVVAQTWAHVSRLAGRHDRSIAERWWLLRLVHLECEQAARGASPRRADSGADGAPVGVLRRALQGLPVRRRAAWIMHELMDMRAVGIAAVLTTSEWQAQALVADARKNLVAHFVRRELRTAQHRAAQHQVAQHRVATPTPA